jgi:hypothetical protein
VTHPIHPARWPYRFARVLAHRCLYHRSEADEVLSLTHVVYRGLAYILLECGQFRVQLEPWITM